jgi:hypothetical protein
MSHNPTEILKQLSLTKGLSVSSLITIAIPYNYHFSNIRLFLTKEIADAKNIKNRINRQTVSRLLTKLDVYFNSKDIDKYKQNFGLVIYIGIDEYNNEIFEILEPLILLNNFYYRCSDKFEIDRFINLFEDNNSRNIFITLVDGNQCIIYELNKGQLIKKSQLNANLIKRHKKGGQSAVRFGRLAEESRQTYITLIMDKLKIYINNNPCLLFGSNELTKMLMDYNNNRLNIYNGGFIDMNNKQSCNQILNTIYISDVYLQLVNNEEDIYMLEEIVKCLDMNVEMLDFDINNKDKMKYWLDKDKLDKQANFKNGTFIHLYERLYIFDYIGLKYYKDQIYEEN